MTDRRRRRVLDEVEEVPSPSTHLATLPAHLLADSLAGRRAPAAELHRTDQPKAEAAQWQRDRRCEYKRVVVDVDYISAADDVALLPHDRDRIVRPNTINCPSLGLNLPA